MSNALFINISTKPFTGYWNGKPKTFKPGQQMYMEEYLARHFAKHLTNQLLLEKGLENCTSPKFPDQVPQFKEIFDQICIVESPQEEMNEVENDIERVNRQHNTQISSDIEPPKAKNAKGSAKAKSAKVTVMEEAMEVPVPSDDESDENAEFQGLNQK